MRAVLRRDLTNAIRTRDAVAASALRAALAAIENAEAVAAPETRISGTGPSPVAGALVGLGAAEVPRRELTEAEVEEIVRGEVADLLAAAGEYAHRGQHARAEQLRAEAAVLSRYLASG
ncbi:MAG TPA: hypothetical protein VE953_15495 [Terriglobales bacterium]|nr:hypothetical protein [Terriglobales bacterium]